VTIGGPTMMLRGVLYGGGSTIGCGRAAYLCKRGDDAVRVGKPTEIRRHPTVCRRMGMYSLLNARFCNGATAPSRDGVPESSSVSTQDCFRTSQFRHRRETFLSGF